VLLVFVDPISAVSGNTIGISRDSAASGKTSNVNLELFHMIFNNPGNGTYF
jgi:hypothetical protein